MLASLNHKQIIPYLPRSQGHPPPLSWCMLMTSLHDLRKASSCVNQNINWISLKMQDYWASAFPMEQQLHMTPTNGTSLSDPFAYRRLVGHLIYLTVTRLDIVYSVHILSRFMQDPRTTHMDAAIRVLQYLKGTPGKGILLSSSNPLTLSGFCDSDWAGLPCDSTLYYWFLCFSWL